MTPRKRLVGFGAFALAASLVLTACGGGGGGEEPPAEGESTGIVTVGNGEPQNPLIPARTNEVFGGLVVTNIFAGLSYYDAEGAVHNDVAESIESDDNQTWNVTLQDGWEFSDGTPVTAKSFVDAWNWAAYGPNGANLASFFSSIEGFTEAQGEYEIDDEGNVKVITEPETETMSGLEVVSDTEFTIKLSQPESDFPIRLGYAAYYPLPEVFFDDPEAFGEAPIGNGPYVLDSWEHDSAITLLPNESYQGDRAAQNGGIELIAYTDEDAQYNDLLSGNLDIVQNVPASAFATFEEELGERAVNQPAATLGAMSVPEWVEEFSGEAGLMRRKALSMAINREEITETLYAGARTPARDFTSPVIDGWSDSIPGNEVLDYNPEEAKALWDEAEQMEPWGDKVLEIHTNTDSDHQEWVEAACNGYENDLGIQCEMVGYPTFDEFLNERDKGKGGKIDGLFRAGWAADYPSLQNYLGPIYTKAALAGSNDSKYVNEEFEAKLTEAAGAATTEEANALYNEAQEILFQDMPGIPLWYYNTTAGYSELVENAQFGWDDAPLLYQVTKTE